MNLDRGKTQIGKVKRKLSVDRLCFAYQIDVKNFILKLDFQTYNTNRKFKICMIDLNIAYRFPNRHLQV